MENLFDKAYKNWTYQIGDRVILQKSGMSAIILDHFLDVRRREVYLVQLESGLHKYIYQDDLMKEKSY